MLETNITGTVTSDEKYLAYGKQRDSGKVATDHRFTGQKEDASGLQYFNARYFDPQTGMFVSPDTIVPQPGLASDYNRYLAFQGNPMKFVDPTGHFSEEQLNYVGLYKDKVDPNLWELLMYAQPNDIISFGGWSFMVVLYSLQPVGLHNHSLNLGFVGGQEGGTILGLDGQPSVVDSSFVGSLLSQSLQSGNKVSVQRLTGQGQYSTVIKDGVLLNPAIKQELSITSGKDVRENWAFSIIAQLGIAYGLGRIWSSGSQATSIFGERWGPIIESALGNLLLNSDMQVGDMVFAFTYDEGNEWVTQTFTYRYGAANPLYNISTCTIPKTPLQYGPSRVCQ